MLDQPDKVAVAQMLQTQEIYGSNPIHLLNYIATGKPPHLQYDIWWSATFNLKETLFDQIWIFICIKQQRNSGNGTDASNARDLRFESHSSVKLHSNG